MAADYKPESTLAHLLDARPDVAHVGVAAAIAQLEVAAA